MGFGSDSRTGSRSGNATQLSASSFEPDTPIMHGTCKQHGRGDQEDHPRLGQRTYDPGKHKTTGYMDPIQLLPGSHEVSLLSSDVTDM